MKNLWVLVITIFIKSAYVRVMTISEYEDPNNTSIPFSDVIPHKVHNGTLHAFFRSLDEDAGPGGTGSRRVFGGSAADLKEFPGICALLDRYWAVRCTATILSHHWVLTAAHCVTSRISYVKYNTRRPASNEGNVTAVHFLYRHPKYEVVQKDEGRGMDVTVLHHDVGLVRTRDPMKLTAAQSVSLNSLRLVNPVDLYNKEVKVLGFGRTERSVLGDELFSVKLQLVGCERGEWYYCVCGIANKPRGVCSGDSGGPVLYEGTPVGVTSMGPVECAHSGEAPPAGATSVFTALYQYADVINATILDAEAALRMRIISRAAVASPRRVLLVNLLYFLHIR